MALTPRVQAILAAQLSAKQAVFLSELDRVFVVRWPRCGSASTQRRPRPADGGGVCVCVPGGGRYAVRRARVCRTSMTTNARFGPSL